METVKEIVDNKYRSNLYKLENNFNEFYDNDPNFKKLVNSIKLPKKELMKYTSSLNDTVCELNNCKKCKNILCCKNTIEGYVYYPTIESENFIIKIAVISICVSNIILFNIPIYSPHNIAPFVHDGLFSTHEATV